MTSCDLSLPSLYFLSLHPPCPHRTPRHPPIQASLTPCALPATGLTAERRAGIDAIRTVSPQLSEGQALRVYTMSQTPGLYHALAASIAPAVFGRDSRSHG